MKEEQPHAKRGKFKNGNQPGDYFKAPRCGARTRKETSCKAPAMENGRCRLHGGKSTGAPIGNQNALKHGEYSASSIQNRRELRSILRQFKMSLSVI